MVVESLGCVWLALVAVVDIVVPIRYAVSVDVLAVLCVMIEPFVDTLYCEVAALSKNSSAIMSVCTVFDLLSRAGGAHVDRMLPERDARSSILFEVRRQRMTRCSRAVPHSHGQWLAQTVGARKLSCGALLADRGASLHE